MTTRVAPVAVAPLKAAPPPRQARVATPRRAPAENQGPADRGKPAEAAVVEQEERRRRLVAVVVQP
ncbi:MAG: hypothetical protein SF187_24360 [Deltaproteobacteria bacterium]|nr:hypothetical protein [Deltaproteobacteria bacterium]